MCSSILSTADLGVLWFFLAIIILAILIIVACKIGKMLNKKDKAKEDKAWEENVKRNQYAQEQKRKKEENERKAYLEQKRKKEENEKRAYIEQLDNMLELIFNYKADNIVKLWRSKKSSSAVDNFLKSKMENHMYDLDYYVMPKKYFIDFNIDHCNDSNINKYTEMMDFISKKTMKAIDESMESANEIDEVDEDYTDLEIILDFYNYMSLILTHHIECVINYDSFVCEMDEYDLRDLSNGIEGINSLFLGLNGLGIIKNFTLEDFYTFVALKQYNMNIDRLLSLCNKYDVNNEKVGNDICDLISQLSDMSEDYLLNNYFVSHPNNVLFDIVKCVANKNGEDDLAELLILIISHNSSFNYSESICVARAILNSYNNTEKAKVKAANYINGINKSNVSVNIYDIDAMNGVEFEEFVGKLFVKLGYVIEITKASGDQGVDLIAKKDGKVLAIQAKRYSGVVGNHAIMEVVAGMKYYNCNCCMVITNSTFTPAAKELANANNVELWDRNELKEQMEFLGML